MPDVSAPMSDEEIRARVEDYYAQIDYEEREAVRRYTAAYRAALADALEARADGYDDGMGQTHLQAELRRCADLIRKGEDAVTDADAKFSEFARTLVKKVPRKTLADRASTAKFTAGVAKARRRLDAEVTLWKAEQRVLKAAVRWFKFHESEDDYCDSCAALHRVMVRYLKSATIAPRAKRGGKGAP